MRVTLRSKELLVRTYTYSLGEGSRALERVCGCRSKQVRSNISRNPERQQIMDECMDVFVCGSDC